MQWVAADARSARPLSPFGSSGGHRGSALRRGMSRGAGGEM